jgi:hypothetical protein
MDVTAGRTSVTYAMRSETVTTGGEGWGLEASSRYAEFHHPATIAKCVAAVPG